MHYSYKSNGIVSRSIRDYRDNLLSDFSTFRIWEGDKEFTEGQYQTVRISDVNYGTVGDYGSQGIGSRTKGTGVGSDTQIASGGIHIVGERGTTYLSGSAVTYVNQQPVTSIVCTGGVCVYSYEAGNVSETVGQHGSNTISFLGARKISSFQFIFDTWQHISRFTGAAECRAYIYEPCITEDYNELDYGLITANHTNTIDNGSVTQVNAVTIEDRGNILDRYRTRFGFKKVIGKAEAAATNAWIGSGRIRKFGRQSSPAIYSWITDGKVKHLPTLFRVHGTADVAFTTSGAGGGFTPLTGTAQIGITAVAIGDGNLRKFGGSAESATWNPDEKQMLFSFVGGLTSEKHTESYRGSGRIRNLAKVKAEKGTYDYIGSGSFKLRPRKPIDWTLADLANFTLEDNIDLGHSWRDHGNINYPWTQTTKLSSVLVKQLTETDHEKHTEAYNNSAFVPYSEVDYGTLVNQANLNCVAVSGTISTNTTASTGCTKVAPGTTLAVAPSNTYTVPTIQTTPTSTIDYGNVADAHAPVIDHGWILGERSDLRTPYGLFKITSTTDVVVTQQFHFTSDGTPPIFKILGKTALPLDVSEEGSGHLFTMGGSAESVSTALDGTGLFRFLSRTTTTRARDFVGFGTLRKISGAAESLTWNPTEEQILFSIIGVGTEKHTEVYRGDGRLSTFSGAAETIRWSAQHTTGLYRIAGDSHDTRARAFAGSGSLRKFNGVAESLTFNPLERDMLFSFTGGITSEKHTEVYVGSGRIRNLATLKAEKGTFDYVGSGTLNLNPRKPQIYQLSDLGSFTLDFYSLRNAYINLGYFHTYTDYTNLAAAQLKWLSLEEGHEKHTEAYNNSACEDGVALDYGDLVNQANLVCVNANGVITTNTTSTTGCIKVQPGQTLTLNNGVTYTVPAITTTPSDFEDYGLVSESNAPEWRDYGHILGSIGKVCPYGAFEIAGAAKTHYVENIITTGYSVTGKAGVTLFGAADTFWTPPYYGGGWTPLTGTVGESFTPATEIGSGILFSMGGAAETTAQVWKADGLFRVGGDGYCLFSLLHPGSGLIRITGEGEEPRGRVYTGSGSLRKFSGAAESATWNPLERQMLFSFTGVGTETFTANPPEEGTEIRLSGTTHPELLTFAEQPFGRIPISGEGATPRTRPFIGSGSLRKFSGAAESITFNPDEKQMLFSFLGTGTETFTANPPEEGAEIRLRGEGVVRATISQVGDIRIPIFGDALTPRSRPFIGSGSLKKFSGAAESITFNPLERQLLFSFTGTGVESRSVPELGSGRLFAFSGSVVSTAADYESTGLFRVSGESSVLTSQSHVGSGSLRKFSGAAESITFNPDEKQMLFSFTGSGGEKHTEDYVGSYDEPIRIGGTGKDQWIPNWNSRGGIRIRVQSTYRFAPVWIGSGTLKKFSGAAESITFNPDEKQMLFSFTGTGAESIVVNPPEEGTEIRLSGDSFVRWVPNNIGSGNIFITGNADPTHYVPHVTGSGGLWTWSGAAESQAIAITSIPSLFRVYGDGHVSRTRPYIGSGSLKKLSGSAESITFNPDEKQMLFSFLGSSATTRARTKVGQGTVKTLGESTSRFSPVFFGSGTTRVSGEATLTRTRHFVGFGTLRKISGAAESLTWNPEEKQMLFSFGGVGADSKTSKLLSQGGVLTVRGTSGDPLLTFAEQPEVQIAVSGDSTDLRSHAYQGSGRISNVNNADDAYIRAPYIGSGQIGPITGIAFVQVVVWQPPSTQVWII